MKDDYVFKKEVDWSLLNEGLTIALENQIVFKEVAGRILNKGDKKKIHLELYGNMYDAILTNVNFDKKYKGHKDIIQIRYSKNSDLAHALQGIFSSSYSYIKNIRENRDKSDRSYIKLPEGAKEYLCLYTTEYDDVYSLDAITNYDFETVKIALAEKTEQTIESQLYFEETDPSASVQITNSIRKYRKLNKSIGRNLKLLYGYRCQICGRLIGEEYGSHIAEAHHIDYFVNSLNNDSSNIMIVCPNHHSIIHDANPIFDRSKKIFIYANGYSEGLMLNQHIY